MLPCELIGQEIAVLNVIFPVPFSCSPISLKMNVSFFCPYSGQWWASPCATPAQLLLDLQRKVCNQGKATVSPHTTSPSPESGACSNSLSFRSSFSLNPMGDMGLRFCMFQRQGSVL